VVARSRLPFVLWVAAALFILYGTTIPFDFVFDRRVVFAHLSNVRLNPLISPETGSRVSIPDFVGNVLLFVPFGLFGIWSLVGRRSPIVRIVWLTLLGCALSGAVETLQLFTIDRTTSMADVFANTLGTLAGAVAATVLRASGRRLLSAANASGIAAAASCYPLLIAAILLCAAVWEPFDVTLDVGSVVSKLRGLILDPWQGGPLTDEALSWTQHLLFTSILLMWLREIGAKRAAATAALVGIGAAVGLEASQLFIAERMPGFRDAAIGVAGALCGLAIGNAFPKIKRPALWCGGLFLATAIGAAMQQLSPFERAAEFRSFQWRPFFNYYAFTSGQTVSHSAELLLAYFPLGFGLALAIERRRIRTVAVLLAALVIAAPVEYAQRFVGGRFPDVTDIALSVAGAWLGAWTATEGWRRFDAELALISSVRRSVDEAF
jgi:VanZ family protein